jgi:hypothetical protein
VSARSQAASAIDRAVYDARQCLRARETGPTGAADFASDAARHLETLLGYVDQIEADAGDKLSTVLGWFEVKGERYKGRGVLEAVDSSIGESDT